MSKTRELPGMAMDNFEVKVTARSSDLLKHTMELALCGSPSGKIEGFRETEAKGELKRLELYWHVESVKGVTKFPYAFRIEQLLPFVNGWLESQDYGDPDDFDGSASKGWKLWNIPHQLTYISFIVQPEWAEHHK